jgi:hypothetical protein
VRLAPVAARPPARRVTRDVAPEALRDLLDRPPRASMAFVRAGAPNVLPARVRMSGQRQLFAIDADAAPALEQREIVLLVDDGPYWCQLRGVSVRRIAVPVDPPLGDEPQALAW